MDGSKRTQCEYNFHIRLMGHVYQYLLNWSLVSVVACVTVSVILSCSVLIRQYLCTVVLVPYRIQCNSSSNRSPYRIQCNSSSNRSPYRIQCNSNSVPQLTGMNRQISKDINR